MKYSLVNRQGFTLLELLVTATMIAVLTVIGIVSYSSVNKRSRDVKRKSDLEQVRSALEMYRSDNGFYPPGTGNPISFYKISNSSSGVQQLITDGYLPATPTDPSRESTSPYRYKLKNLSGGNYYGYCICACLESSPCKTLISNTCDASDWRTQEDCNYYLKNP